MLTLKACFVEEVLQMFTHYFKRYIKKLMVIKWTKAIPFSIIKNALK